MATTATLNGGLHAPLLDKEERVDSNSSFESGQEAGPHWSPHDPAKKRRKQSRPVRIPAPDPPPLPLNLSARHDSSSDEPPLKTEPTGTNLAPLDSSSSSIDSGPLLPPHRIFNPEAYCDLCNKEFCNKYFLKTHKANKHGVYSELAPSFLTGPPLSQPPLPPLQPQAPKQPDLLFPSGLPSGDKGNNGMGRESFCTLCQKEFCNKYFLKRHKAKIHGIPMEGSSSGRSSSSSNPGKRNGEAQEEGKSGEREEGELEPRELKGDTTCQFCLRDFPSRPALYAHLVKKHGLVSSFPPFLLPFPSLFEEPLVDNNGNSAPEGDFQCALCARSFQTIYLLRMHKSYFHPDDPPEGGKPEDDTGFHSETVSSGKASPCLEEKKDSDDLRRLQTMIMELNRVSSAAVAWSPPLDTTPQPTLPSSNTFCQICSKEFYSTYFLQQHIQHYHTAPSSDPPIHVKTESPAQPPEPPEPLLPPEIIPNPSPQDIISQGTLKERLLQPEGFGASDLLAGSSTFLAPGPKGSGSNSNSLSKGESGGKRPSPSLSRSYCTICHKELCNKYFMRTHMLKMHGISIESSTGLGGVTCDICNKELCSKYFLKVHKQNTHGIVEEGPSPPAPSTPTAPAFPLGLNLSTQDLLDPAAPLLPKEPMDLQTRYFCHYSEVCPFCGRRFRSPKWLKSHLTQDHGEEGRERWKSIEKTLNAGRRPQPKTSSSAKSPPRPPKSESAGEKPLKSRDGCAFCHFTSPDVGVLKAHLVSEHGSELGGREEAMLLDPLTLLFQKMEGGSNKLYRCTYCPFTTSILVYLYAHERTHTGLLPQRGPEGPTYQCPMCFHTFEAPEPFQQHLIGHQMSGVLAPFFTPPTRPLEGDVPNGNHYWAPNGQEAAKPKKKRVFRCSLCHRRFGTREACRRHIHIHRRVMTFRCRKCKFRAGSYQALAVHSKARHSVLRPIYSQHRVVRTRSVSTETGATCPLAGEEFLMQGFLMAEEEERQTAFLPSLVYLPVREKVSESVRVSFSLTPT